MMTVVSTTGGCGTWVVGGTSRQEVKSRAVSKNAMIARERDFIGFPSHRTTAFSAVGECYAYKITQKGFTSLTFR
jgi:hypothetical protein